MAVLAHRGGTGPWRENTLEAFAGARLAGADGVELDTRLTADGIPVVLHDSEVAGAGQVHAMGFGDLPSWVPSLEEALQACGGWAVNVEIKNGPGEPGFDERQTVARRVAELIAGDAAGRQRPSHLVVSSFWAATLAAVRESAPDLALGLLTHPAFKVADALRDACDLGCAAAHLHHSQVRVDVVDRAHELGMAVVTWTVNGERDVVAAVSAGVDGLITDEVASTLAALRPSSGGSDT